MAGGYRLRRVATTITVMRTLLFAGFHDSPRGGAADLMGWFESEADGRAAFHELRATRSDDEGWAELVALCRPVLSGDVFTEPASIRAMAAELVVSEAAVKQHLLNLYDKFAIYGVDNRRLELANQAVRRGAVSIADLRRPPAAGA